MKLSTLDSTPYNLNPESQTRNQALQERLDHALQHQRKVPLPNKEGTTYKVLRTFI